MEIMRKLIAATAALALAMPVAMVPTAPAQAQSHYKGKSSKSRTYYKKCRRSSGTAGLVGGAAVGVLAGPAIIGHGLLGAAVTLCEGRDTSGSVSAQVGRVHLRADFRAGTPKACFNHVQVLADEMQEQTHGAAGARIVLPWVDFLTQGL